MIRRLVFGSVLLCAAMIPVHAQYYYNFAAMFNGTSSYIAVPNGAEVNPSTAMTLEAWIYPTAFKFPTSAIVSKNPRSSYSLGINTLGQVLFYPIGDPGSYLVSKSTTHIPLNTWTHLAATYDGATTMIIINGKVDTSTAVIRGPIATNTDSLFIGAENNVVFQVTFQGMMDDVRMWNIARQPQTIAAERFVPLAIANPSGDGQYAGFLNAWRMNGNTFDEGGFSANNGIARDISYLDLRQKPVNYVDYNNTLLINTDNSYCVGSPQTAFNATTAITLEAWVYESFPQNGNFQAIMVKGGETSWNYGLFSNPVAPLTQSGFRIYFAINYGDTLVSPVVPAESWMHVAATYNSTTRNAVIYVNGDSVAGRVFPSAGLIPNDPDSLFIGDFRPSQGRYQFQGQIDQVRIWRNVVRTGDQIRANMYNSIDYSTIPTPGSSLTVYSFDGRNTNEMAPHGGVPSIDFIGGARLTSEHLQLGGEYTSPMLRDDPGDFAGPTYVKGKKQLDIPDNTTPGVIDSVYVSAAGPSTNVKLFMLLSHPNVSALNITLTSPTGVSSSVFGGGKGGFARDIMAIITDSADSTGGNGSGAGFQAPFSPFLKPVTPFSAFIGQSRQGWWKLKVFDSGANNFGRLYAWGLQTSPLTDITGTVGLTQKFDLMQNYPNPFNPTTTIRYELAKASQATLIVYDVLGREVQTLVNELKPPGRYEAVFDAKNLASGVYFYRLQAGTYVDTRKLLLLR
jgi:subtilisin-like proprotein convertase family protein